MSFLKKEVKRIGYLAKPLKPLRDLYETTFDPPQFVPSITPLKKRRRTYKPPSEFFYDEPYNELMKKMEKEEVQQRTESLVRKVVEEANEQESARRFVERMNRMENDPVLNEKEKELEDFLVQVYKNPDGTQLGLHLARADAEQLQKVIDELKQEPKNAWLKANSLDEMLPGAEATIRDSEYIDDEEKQELLAQDPKDVVKSALTFLATPSMIERADVKSLTKLLQDVLNIDDIDHKKNLFQQVRPMIEKAFGHRFSSFTAFYNSWGGYVQLLEDDKRRRERQHEAKKHSKYVPLSPSAASNTVLQKVKSKGSRLVPLKDGGIPPSNVVPVYKDRSRMTKTVDMDVIPKTDADVSPITEVNITPLIESGVLPITEVDVIPRPNISGKKRKRKRKPLVSQHDVQELKPDKTVREKPQHLLVHEKPQPLFGYQRLGQRFAKLFPWLPWRFSH